MFRFNLFTAPFQLFQKQEAGKLQNTSSVHRAHNNKDAIENNNGQDKSKIISINTGDDMDFVEVDIKKLSYAEVAALSRTQVDNGYGGADGNQSLDDNVVDLNELESEVSDYQMSQVLSKNKVNTKQCARQRDIENGIIPADLNRGVAITKTTSTSTSTSTPIAANVKSVAIINNNHHSTIDEDSEGHFDEFYNDKLNRRTKKSKFLKKGK